MRRGAFAAAVARALFATVALLPAENAPESAAAPSATRTPRIETLWQRVTPGMVVAPIRLFSFDGMRRFAVATEDRHIRLHDLQGRTVLSVRTGHRRLIGTLSDGGDVLGALGTDGSVVRMVVDQRGSVTAPPRLVSGRGEEWTAGWMDRTGNLHGVTANGDLMHLSASGTLFSRRRLPAGLAAATDAGGRWLLALDNGMILAVEQSGAAPVFARVSGPARDLLATVGRRSAPALYVLGQAGEVWLAGEDEVVHRVGTVPAGEQFVGFDNTGQPLLMRSGATSDEVVSLEGTIVATVPRTAGVEHHLIPDAEGGQAFIASVGVDWSLTLARIDLVVRPEQPWPATDGPAPPGPLTAWAQGVLSEPGERARFDLLDSIAARIEAERLGGQIAEARGILLRLLGEPFEGPGPPGSDYPRVRLAAIELLSRFGDTPTVRALTRVVQIETDLRVVSAAVGAIVDSGLDRFSAASRILNRYRSMDAGERAQIEEAMIRLVAEPVGVPDDLRVEMLRAIANGGSSRGARQRAVRLLTVGGRN